MTQLNVNRVVFDDDYDDHFVGFNSISNVVVCGLFSELIYLFAFFRDLIYFLAFFVLNLLVYFIFYLTV